MSATYKFIIGMQTERPFRMKINDLSGQKKLYEGTKWSCANSTNMPQNQHPTEPPEDDYRNNLHLQLDGLPVCACIPLTSRDIQPYLCCTVGLMCYYARDYHFWLLCCIKCHKSHNFPQLNSIPQFSVATYHKFSMLLRLLCFWKPSHVLPSVFKLKVINF